MARMIHTSNILIRPRLIDETILDLTQRRDALESSLLPSGIDYSADKTQSSPKDRMAAVAAEIADIDVEIGNLKERRAAAVGQIIQAVGRLPDPRERIVLMGFYVNGLTMQQIGDQLHYSRTHTYRIHQSGVDNINSIVE